VRVATQTDLGERASRILSAFETCAGLAGDRRRLISVTAPVEVSDPVAVVFASRLAGDRWFAWEEPDRGFALAALGSAEEAISRGPHRFEDVLGQCTAATRERIADEPTELPAGAGPVWTGGFAFAADGGRSPHWSSFPPGLMTLPELAIVRGDGGSWLTLAAFADSADSERIASRMRRRLASVTDAALPLLDPHPTGAARITSVAPPRTFEEAVEAAVARIGEREFEKVVLAREVTVEAPSAHSPAALFGALRELFPSCFCFCVGSPEGAFLGASPELLVRRRGAGASSVALAGSTRRSADPAVDDHLGEQLRRSKKDRAEHEIVARRIERTLRPYSVWVETAAEAELIKVANIQHLATPVRAQLADSMAAIELAGALHPTPAVGGEPRPAALAAIPELERMDRGWYAGPVGWMDVAEDGDFCVALRSALLRDRTAHLYAGGGIVADSDPAAELAETEVKLEALLPLLSG
jgi:salicylate biosynthesis isochorismate synthase/menaquinone-specific isochorismate synthase